MSGIRPALFEGGIATSTTKYIGVPIHRSGAGKVLGVSIGWLDGTTAATITLELGNEDDVAAPVEEAGDAWEWTDSGETVTGPTGSAAGSAQIFLMNVQALRARLKIVTSATSEFVIRDGGA